MMVKQSDPNEAIDSAELARNLRQRAETQLKDGTAQLSARLSSGETQQVLHELQVHEIELALQNEELRQTQTELEASRVLYFDLYDLAPVGYVTLSEAGLILEANLTAAGLLGLARSALLKQPLTRFIVAEDQDSYYRHRKHLFETGVPQAYELRLTHAEAAPFWAQVEATLTPPAASTAGQAAGGAPMCRVVFSDITARKEVEATLLAERASLTQRVEARTAELSARTAELSAANQRLRQLTRQIVMAHDEERRHLARELHDEAGQMLTGLKFTLETGQRLPLEGMQATQQQALGLVGELMQQVHNLSLDLHPVILDDFGLLPTLLWHIGRYTAQTKIQVNFEHAGLEQRFAAEIETAAYRIVQEALTNIARHSGASQATVRLWVTQDMLQVQIEDQGVGFDPDKLQATQLINGASLGLASMRERVLLLEGQLTLESAP